MVAEPEPFIFAARFFLLARFFLFLPAFFPGAEAGADCMERIIVAVVAVVAVVGVVVVAVVIVEMLSKTDNLSIFRVI